LKSFKTLYYLRSEKDQEEEVEDVTLQRLKR